MILFYNMRLLSHPSAQPPSPLLCTCQPFPTLHNWPDPSVRLLIALAHLIWLIKRGIITPDFSQSREKVWKTGKEGEMGWGARSAKKKEQDGFGGKMESRRWLRTNQGCRVSDTHPQPSYNLRYVSALSHPGSSWCPRRGLNGVQKTGIGWGEPAEASSIIKACTQWNE